MLISALGEDTGGGLYAIRDTQLTTIDEVSSTGLAVAPSGDRLARLFWVDGRVDVPGEIVVYDSSGPLQYRRLDEVRAPHSVLWDGDELAVVSTGTNALVWVDPEKGIVRRWQAPGDGGDCWHLNSLYIKDRHLLISAFGRFSANHAWTDVESRAGTGFVLDLETRREVLNGLSSPHNPTWLDGFWLICNSAEGELLRLTPRGEIAERCVFSGWTRGIAYDDEHVYLGVSAHRLRGLSDQTAFVAAVTRSSFREVQRWPLPCREIYEVLFAPTTLVDGLHADWSVAINRRRLRVA